jgi:hypothetical protein
MFHLLLCARESATEKGSTGQKQWLKGQNIHRCDRDKRFGIGARTKRVACSGMVPHLHSTAPHTHTHTRMHTLRCPRTRTHSRMSTRTLSHMHAHTRPVTRVHTCTTHHFHNTLLHTHTALYALTHDSHPQLTLTVHTHMHVYALQCNKRQHAMQEALHRRWIWITRNWEKVFVTTEPSGPRQRKGFWGRCLAQDSRSAPVRFLWCSKHRSGHI